jgi:hypothetical protein
VASALWELKSGKANPKRACVPFVKLIRYSLADPGTLELVANTLAPIRRIPGGATIVRRWMLRGHPQALRDPFARVVAGTVAIRVSRAGSAVIAAFWRALTASGRGSCCQSPSRRSQSGRGGVLGPRPSWWRPCYEALAAVSQALGSSPMVLAQGFDLHFRDQR